MMGGKPKAMLCVAGVGRWGEKTKGHAMLCVADGERKSKAMTCSVWLVDTGATCAIEARPPR